MILFLSWMAIIAGVLFVFVGVQHSFSRHQDSGFLFIAIGVGIAGVGGFFA